MTSIQLRMVTAEELLPEQEVLSEGFAGYTMRDYPEPVRTYQKIYGQMAAIFAAEQQRGKIRPQLLVSSPVLGTPDKVLGLIVTIWSDNPERQCPARLTVLPIRRAGEGWQVDEKVAYLFDKQVKEARILDTCVCLRSPLASRSQ